MSALSPEVIIEFCKLCDWAHEVWLNHLALFDENPHWCVLRNSFANEELARISRISQEYSILQIAKLHDSPVVSGHITLGVEYIYKSGDWEPAIQTCPDSLNRLLRRCIYMLELTNEALLRLRIGNQGDLLARVGMTYASVDRARSTSIAV